MKPSTRRIRQAYETARDELLAQRVAAGHWVGELSTSALSTATAVSALSMVLEASRGDPSRPPGGDPAESSPTARLISRGVGWLAEHQNEDGGWGDTEKSYSNISTTMLAVAAFHLAGVADRHENPLGKAQAYIQRSGGFDGLRRRYGKDKTFAVPILTNYALAGLASWNEVSSLPFELACLPQSWYRFARLPVVSYAIPALVAVGQVRFARRPPAFPPWRGLRRLAIEPSLRVLKEIQPASGGYLEAVPLTSFVVMSLAGAGRAEHEVTRKGVEFIAASVREDGSWPIDTNLATWNTTLAINALAAGGEDVARLECLDWLLSCQYRTRHPFTGSEPGGWGWSDLTGAVPDADDTPSALLALHRWERSPSCSDQDRRRIREAAAAGVEWLLNLQNSDGGWPTFCRGWGRLPFDRSGDDLTAHAVRALHAWRHGGARPARIDRAMRRGFAFLERRQAAAGCWMPLWFGNQDHPQEQNPVYGTAKVLAAYRDTGRASEDSARRAVRWLIGAQQADGGWGGGEKWDQFSGGRRGGSVEETALAVEALLGAEADGESQEAIDKGLAWICDSVLDGSFTNDSPIGFYFAKLWYHEKLYPVTFTVSALGHAVRHEPRIAHLGSSSRLVPTLKD